MNTESLVSQVLEGKDPRSLLELKTEDLDKVQSPGYGNAFDIDTVLMNNGIMDFKWSPSMGMIHFPETMVAMSAFEFLRNSPFYDQLPTFIRSGDSILFTAQATLRTELRAPAIGGQYQQNVGSTLNPIWKLFKIKDISQSSITIQFDDGRIEIYSKHDWEDEILTGDISESKRRTALRTESFLSGIQDRLLKSGAIQPGDTVVGCEESYDGASMIGGDCWEVGVEFADGREGTLYVNDKWEIEWDVSGISDHLRGS